MGGLPEKPISVVCLAGNCTVSADWHEKRHPGKLRLYYLESFAIKPAAVERVMTEMVALHRRRWRDQAHGSIFDNPRKARYYREAMRWAVEGQLAGITVIRFESRLVAAVSLLFDPRLANGIRALPGDRQDNPL